MARLELVNRLKGVIRKVALDSQIILYVLEARGTAKKDSDIDILILMDKKNIYPSEEDKATAPIYDLESGTVISPIVMTRRA